MGHTVRECTMEASRVSDFSAVDTEQHKGRWMSLDISTEERETGQLNGPQGCPGSSHQLCPLNINLLCGVCTAAGAVLLEAGAMCHACSPNAYTQVVLCQTDPCSHP